MSDNLGLPQMTAQTANKEQFLDDLFALLDSSVTAAVAIDGSMNAIVPTQTIQNYIKVTATSVPKAGTTLTFTPMSKMFIVKNDKASAGPVTFACGNGKVVVASGVSLIVHMDGTANGIEVVSAASVGALATLSDVDESTAPTDGQALVYNAAASKWKPGTVAVSSGSSGGTTTTTTSSSSTTGFIARYWRLYAYNSQANNGVSVGDFSFLDASGAVIAPSAVTGYPGLNSTTVVNTQDSDESTFYDNSSALSNNIAFDFGAAVAPVSVKLGNRGDGHSEYNWLYGELECSADNKVWTHVCTLFNSVAGTVGAVSTYTIPSQVVAPVSGGGSSNTKAPPKAATWTQQNFIAATKLEDYAGPGAGVYLHEVADPSLVVGNHNTVRAALIPIPDAHFSVTAKFRKNGPWVNYCTAGFVLRDNASGRSVTIGECSPNNGAGYLKLTSDTDGYDGATGFDGQRHLVNEWWGRLTYDGTATVYSVSQDGYTFIPLFRSAEAACKFGYLTNGATHFGFGSSINNGDNTLALMDVLLLSWEYAALA